MTYNDFVFWLDGYLEGRSSLEAEEVALIKKNLSSVFVKVTPDESNYPSWIEQVEKPKSFIPEVEGWEPLPDCSDNADVYDKHLYSC